MLMRRAEPPRKLATTRTLGGEISDFRHFLVRQLVTRHFSAPELSSRASAQEKH
jgi:hypothetical protein